MDAPPQNQVPIVIWWIVWLGITAGLILIYTFLPPSATHGDLVVRYFPIGPFALSVLVRWLVLPRFTKRVKAFPIFIIGLAMAESTGITGIFLAPEFRQAYFVLSLLALAQFVPLFSARYEA